MEVESGTKMADKDAGKTVLSGCVGTSNLSTPETGEPLSSDTHDDVVNTTAQTGLALSDTQHHSSNINIASMDTLAMPTDQGSSEEVVLLAVNPVSSYTAPLAAEEPSSAAQPRAGEELPLILCSLSIDSLHCIASFLAPADWSNFGQANQATNRVCNQVFRRVRMHGFRCATEVVSAWVSSSYAAMTRIGTFFCWKSTNEFCLLLSAHYRNLDSTRMLENFLLSTPRREFPSTRTPWDTHTIR